MKEEVLNQGIEIKKRLDTARQIKANIEEKRNLCTGNYSEVAARRFDLRINEGMHDKYIAVASSTAYEALGIELKNICIVVSRLEEELDGLGD